MPLSGNTLVLADRGYTGLAKLHPQCSLPKKSSKKHKLSPEEKRSNAELAKRRIGIEHINRYLKRFRILSSRYRNKRRKFALRATLMVVSSIMRKFDSSLLALLFNECC